MGTRSGCFKIISILVILSLLGAVLYPVILQPWHLSWGATQEEQQAGLPGDEFVPIPERTNTRAITIDAPVGQVWQWLIQLGADRGGLYSYTWLEALINCPIRNADQIHPEWQMRNPGDRFPLCPGEFGPPPYEVVEVIPGQALVLGHRPMSESEQALPGDWFETWTFAVQPIDQDGTRLLIRTRTAVLLGWMQAIEPGIFFMERGLMIGLKARAEGMSMDPSVEALYRLVFGLLLLGYLLVRYIPQNTHPASKAPAGSSEKGQTAVKERVMVWLGWLVMVPILVYPLFSWLDALHLPFPVWLRWLGALIFLGGDLLFYWTRRTLGKAWSSEQGVAPSSSIVTDGPYRRVRHPMYAAMFLITAGMFLLSSNLLVGLPFLALVLYMYLTWVGSEEADLLLRFGDDYSLYMQHTGRLIPRWRN